MSRVLVNNLDIREGPSTSSAKVGIYNIGQIIKSGQLLIENEGNIWLKFKEVSGNTRYVIAYDKDKTPYIDVEPHIPGPRGNSPSSPPTGINRNRVPCIIKCSDPRLLKFGDCFFMHLCKRWLNNRRSIYKLFQMGFG